MIHRPMIDSHRKTPVKVSPFLLYKFDFNPVGAEDLSRLVVDLLRGAKEVRPTKHTFARLGMWLQGKELVVDHVSELRGQPHAHEC